MKCPECRKAELRVSRENHRYDESGLPNVVLADVEVSRCPECGAELVSIPRMAQLHRSLALALINKPWRLTPGEIRYLRKSLGWSGADFARHVHADPSTVSRWENGAQIMAETSEVLLRAMVALGQKIEDYSVDTLAEVARGERQEPAKLRARAAQNGWDTQVEAA